MILIANDYQSSKGKKSWPGRFLLLHPTRVKNMNWNCSFDTSVATLVAPKVVQGNLPLNLFEANTDQVNNVRMGLTQNNPITADGTVAVLRFKAIGVPAPKLC